MTELLFQRLHEDAVVPERAYAGDAGLDLVACEGAEIGPGERAIVGTGLAVAIPPGYAGLVLPRSGLALSQGVTVLNAPGLVDAGYRAELGVVLVNTDPDDDYQVHRGDRIAQLVIQRVEQAEFAVVEALDVTERAGGFGHTGR